MTNKRITLEQAIEMAAEYARQGKNASARKLYNQILRLQPDNAAVRAALDKLPESAPEAGFAADMRRLAELYSAGQWLDAEAAARQFAGQYPTQPMPQNILGAALVMQGRYEESIVALRAAVELAPDYSEAWSNLGNAQLESGAEVEAVESYRRALALDRAPAFVASASRGLGKALASLGQSADAVAAFEQALQHDPRDAVTRTGLAMALRDLDRHAAALLQLDKALADNPQLAVAHRERGMTLARMKRDEEAEASLQRSIELSPDNSRTHYRLGQQYAKRGDRDLAAMAYRRSLELNPDSAEVKHLLDAVEGRNTDIAPPEYIEDHFDTFSSTFEQKLVKGLEYRSPQVLTEMIRSNAPEGHVYDSAIDLGCGTGLMGERLKDIALRLIGVDLSPKMLEQAREKEIYSELVCADIVAALAASQQKFDLVTCADVLVYFGDLQPLMRAVAENTGPDAVFALSTELLEDQGDYELLVTGRYAHGRQYVIDSAAKAGLGLLAFEAAPLRKEAGEWLTGGYYLFGCG